MQRAITLGRWLAVLVVGAVLVACSGAEWKGPQVAPGYQPAKQLSVAVVADTSGEDLKEALEEFESTLHDELKSKGIEASMVTGVAAPPGAQLSVTEWKPGSRAARYFAGFGAGEGHITVVVNVTRAD